MTVILVTGLPGSGKSTACGVLARRFGLGVANVGDLLAEELAKSGIPCRSRAEIGIVFLRHRSREKILDLVVSAVARGISVFDGVRLAVTGAEARQRLPSSAIWYVRTSSEQRNKRLRSRLQMELGSQGAIAGALRDYSAYDAEDAELDKLADVHLRNDGSLDRFAALVERKYLASSSALARSRSRAP